MYFSILLDTVLVYIFIFFLLFPDAAIFIFLHGGYWQMQSLGRESYEFIAGPLHKNNIKSIFIGYELCPDVTLSAIIQQVQTATNQCVEYARRKKSRCVCLVFFY